MSLFSSLESRSCTAAVRLDDERDCQNNQGRCCFGVVVVVVHQMVVEGSKGKRHLARLATPRGGSFEGVISYTKFQFIIIDNNNNNKTINKGHMKDHALSVVTWTQCIRLGSGTQSISGYFGRTASAPAEVVGSSTTTSSSTSNLTATAVTEKVAMAHDLGTTTTNTVLDSSFVVSEGVMSPDATISVEAATAHDAHVLSTVVASCFKTVYTTLAIPPSCLYYSRYNIPKDCLLQE